MRTYNFSDSINVGNRGEAIIKDFLAQDPKIKEIIDVSYIPEYQSKDIDFLVEFINGETKSIEVKTDTYISKNIFFETMSNKENNVLGCMYKSEADLLFYFFIKTNELYIFDFTKYREWVDSNIAASNSLFEFRELKNINRRKNGTYTTEGYIIPKKFIEQNFSKDYFKKVILENITEEPEAS